MSDPLVRVCFVCLGNICRSPTAEGVVRHHAARAGLAERLVLDSAGTGDWHVGEPPDERASATVFTSGEHCPMCAAAHGWVGLGRIVYATSSRQLRGWLEEWGIPASPVRPLPIQEIVPGVKVEGPVPELADEVRDLQRRSLARSKGTARQA